MLEKSEQKMLDKIIGSRVDSIAKGHGSFLTIELDCGQIACPCSDASLWVYLCRWSLQKAGKTVTNDQVVSEESEFDFMIGKSFEDYVFFSETNSFELKFSDSISIILTPDLSNYENDDDLLRLTFVGGDTYGYSPSEGWQT